MQGADQVIHRIPSGVTSYRRPKNPTQVLSIRYTAPEDIPAGTVIAVPAPANLYDCTTWDNYFLVDECDYIGYVESTHSAETETKHFLVQTETDGTNYTFDMEE